MGEYTFLTNPAMVQGRLEGGKLVLWVESDFVRSMVGKPAVLQAVAAAAQARLGLNVACAVSVGKPPEVSPGPASAPAAPDHPAASGNPADPGAPAHDNLDDLLSAGARLGGILVEESKP